MKHVIRSIVFTAAMALLGSPLTAQGKSDEGLRSSHPEPMHPMVGTLIAELVSVNGAAADASGRATFNYVPGRDDVIARVTVEGLEPNTKYQVHVAVHGVEEVADVADFWTDGDGDGVVTARLACLEAFNLVNVRKPAVSGSRSLTSWLDDGGSLQQTPDRRNQGNSPPETCPAA